MSAPGTQPPIGIDLGTTYSVTAYLDGSGRPLTIRSAQGDVLTPSAVFVDQQEILVGKQAVKSSADAPQRYAECFKRDMGQAFFRHKLNGLDVPPEILSALVLEQLKAAAQQRLGVPVNRAVVTVPAFFDAQRRGATQEAGKLAGLEVLDIINEPTAAALSYGYEAGFLNPAGGAAPQKQRVLVYDLGGGTFDVTVLEIEGNRFHALATDGDVLLGGKDFDERIVNYVAERFQERHGLDPRSDRQDAAQLWLDAQEAKHALSERSSTTVTCFHSGLRLRVEISREEFQKTTADLLDRTETTASLVVSQAGLDWTQIDRVLLVGGSSRMPAVAAMLHKLTGKEPDRSQSPDEAIALGAALYAGMLTAGDSKSTCELVNVNSHSLGVVGVHPETRQRVVSVLIPKNTALPCKVVKSFRTARPNMRSVSVQVVEGESERPEECILLGQCPVRDLPPGLPAGERIDVEYRYAANGRIAVFARIPAIRHSASVEISRDEVRDLADLPTWRARLLSGQATAQAGAAAAGNADEGVNLRRRLDQLATQIGRAAAATANLPPGVGEKLARSHQLARAAAATLCQAEQQQQGAERALHGVGAGREKIELEARLTQARSAANQARTRADFTCLVCGRECLAANACPPGQEAVFAEAAQLRQNLPPAG